jgi:hypothetical protein
MEYRCEQLIHAIESRYVEIFQDKYYIREHPDVSPWDTGLLRIYYCPFCGLKLFDIDKKESEE